MVCSIVPCCSWGVLVLTEVVEVVAQVALAVVAVLAGLLLEVGSRNQGAQQVMLPTAPLFISS